MKSTHETNPAKKAAPLTTQLPSSDKHTKTILNPQSSTPDQLAPQVKRAEDRQEALIDEGLEESFPASDPLSVKRIT